MRLMLVLAVLAGGYAGLQLSRPSTAVAPPREDVEAWRKSVRVETDWNDYIWPTNAGTVRTSSFGEFRSNHFHAGIDVSTGNQTGFDVYASRAGWVHSITFQPGGYGWLLILRHTDGYYTVYAHLKGFPKKIRDAYRAKLAELGRSYGLAEFRANECPVTKKEVVAYTGDTGAGPPHLHFEVRDRDYNPVHPELAKNIRTVDSIAPELRQLCMMPLDAFSTVEGSNAPQTFAVVKGSDGIFTLSRSVRITGRVGVLLRAHDRANGAQDYPTPYLITTALNETPLFETRFDRIQEKNSWHIRIDRDHWMMKQQKGEFRKLYREEGSDLAVYYAFTDDNGALVSDKLKAGENTLRIIAADIAGNKSVLRVLVQAAPAIHPQPVASTRQGTATVARDFLYGEIVYTVKASAPFTKVPEVTLAQGSEKLRAVVRLVNPTQARAVLAPPPAFGGAVRAELRAEVGGSSETWSEEYTMFPVSSVQGGRIVSPDGKFRMQFAKGDVYRSLICTVSETHDEQGTTYHVFPDDMPLAGRPRVSIECGDSKGAFIKAQSQHAFLKFDRQEGGDPGVVSGLFGRMLASYRVKRDIEGPSIVLSAPARGRITARISDSSSGVDPNSIVLKIGNDIVPLEYSEGQKFYFVPSDVSVSKLKGPVTLTASDLLGNKRAVEGRW